MAGIPSAGGAGRALRGATRVLLRIAVLVGLVVCGWLLGTATGLAQEAGTDDAGPGPDWAHVALAQHRGGAAVVPVDPPPSAGHPRDLLTPLLGAGIDAVAPARAALPLPAQVPGMVLRMAEPLARPVVETVGKSVAEPVAAQVLGTPAPQPADRPDPAPAEVTEQAAPPPSEPAAAAGAAPAAAPHPPQVHAPVPLTVSPLRAPSDPAADRYAGSSAAVDERSTLPVPASPPATASTSCPPGSTGANTVAQTGHAAMLSDAATAADSPLVQRQLNTDAGGLPRCAGERPSTSPD